MNKEYCIVLIIILISSMVEGQNLKDNCNPKSNEFMLVFSGTNSIRDNGNIEEINMNSWLRLQGNSNTQIEINNNKYIIPSSGFLEINESFPIVNKGISENNIIKVKADGNISINAERESKYSTHAFTVIPVTEWGKDYIIPGFQDQSKKYKVNSFIDIIAHDKKTNVTIKDAKGNMMKKITLKSGQNFEFSDVADFTGYSVTADKNIGVISGNYCLRISAACDHVALMLQDNLKLGLKYYNPGTSFFIGNTIHRVVASESNTKVYIDGVLVITLDKGEFYEYRKDTPHIIESSSPVLVYLIFDKRANSPENSVDPSMILLPTINNAVNFVQFSFPDDMIYSKDIRIIMKTDKTSTLLLDGNTPNLKWETFVSDPSVSCATLSFDDLNIHNLSVSDINSSFIPLIMARGWDVSLGSTLKLGFKDLLAETNTDCLDLLPTSITHQNIQKEPVDIILTDINTPINVEKEEITVRIFDDADEDGDIISVYLNDRLIYSNIKVLKTGIVLGLELEKGTNTIAIKAENEGDIYPNTAGLTFDDDARKQTIILRNKKGQSKSLKIISK